MKSVSKMLDWIGDQLVSPGSIDTFAYAQICEMAHAIEAEVESEYMQLPLDANGVPIHVGDVMQGVYKRFEVCAVNSYYAYHGEGKHFDRADLCTHYNPPTIEDVLRQVVTLCANTWKDEKSAFRFRDVDDMMESGNMHDFADKLREAMCDDR